MVELGRQGLVVGQHQRRAVQRFNYLGDGEGLARSSYAEQDLVLLTVPKTARQFGNCGLLIASRTIRDCQSKTHICRVTGAGDGVRLLDCGRFGKSSLRWWRSFQSRTGHQANG